MPPGENRLPQDPPIHFTHVPAEFRAQLIEALKTRQEFRQAWEAAVQGSGVSVSLQMPEPIEFTFGGYHFRAFGWMGQIYVMGEEVSPLDPRGASPETR